MANYPQIDFPCLAFEEIEPIYCLFHHGMQYEFGKQGPGADPKGQRWWQHAEHFLAYLDLAAAEKGTGAASKHLKTYLRTLEQGGYLPNASRLPIVGLATTARRVIAAECCAFLNGYDEVAVQSSEPWDPYVEWAKNLTCDDTIITFNYDRVVELASGGPKGKVAVITDRDVFDEALQNRETPLLKLHGSVDWKWTGSNIKVGDTEHALTCSESELLVATPGPTKKALVQDKLKALWKIAMSCIEEANSVKFIGFRFPETDSVVRRQILKAIGKTPDQEFDIVLGPHGSAQDDARRLESLLRFACGDKTSVRNTFLYGQDYLTVSPAPPHNVRHQTPS